VRLLTKVLFLLFGVVSALSLAPTASAQQGIEAPPPPPPPPRVISHETELILHGPGSTSAGDQGTAPACDPLEGAACPFTECERIIDDDSIFPDGLVWDGDRSVEPIEASRVEEADAINDLVEALMNGVYRRPGEFDTRLELPEYGSMPTGVFAESGEWERCEELHFEVVRDDFGNVSELPLAVLDEVSYGPVGTAELIDPVELYERARAQLDPPDPPLMTAPPKDGLLFVKMPTWYWLEPGYWDEYSASASSPSGRLTVTVTAEPVMVRWDPGDGSEPVLCYDAGVEFIVGLHPWRGSECTHIYQHSSTMAPDGSDTWVLDVEVLFVASWTMSFDNGTDYDRGAIDGETRETSLPLQVGEIQAIIID